MERKIGEIFKYGDEWYQCLKSEGCRGCAFFNINCIDNPNCKCDADERSDDCYVSFTRLKKLGEPYKLGEVLIQQYQGIAPVVLPEDSECSSIFRVISSINVIEIELKQTKEDMEEKKTNFVEAIDALCKRYNMSDGVRTDFMSELKEIIKDKEKCNLKPFDLEAAKSGKPVCTRDGRKARIICFDAILGKGNSLIVLINNGSYESLEVYEIDGRYYLEDLSEYNLMMLPEKKEGWVNVYYYNDASSQRGCKFIYDTKEQAVKEADSAYITTVKISWEE